MVATGTYAFNPSAGDVTLNAFAMAGLKRTDLTVEHFENAAFQANMLGVDFTNRNPNRWAMQEQSFALVAGTKLYSLPPEVVAVSAVWIDQTPAPSATPISRVLGPLSAVEYASIANKDQPGTPTSYFFSLLTPIPTLTLWLVPNGTPVFTMRVQTFRQLQDTQLSNGYTLDTPYRFLDAYVTGLAARLALIYPQPDRPGLAAALQTQYLTAFNLAAQLDQERVSLKMRPGLTGYFPR